jgi:predicted ATPase
MLVLGHGGTGKSMLIEAITETFKIHHSEEKLAKCATSGVAAVIISA